MAVASGSQLSFHLEGSSHGGGSREELEETPTEPKTGLNPIGIYGWRKRCLYFFILLLLVVVVVNLGLTIWILVVLDFNVHGMGNLRITDSGLRLEGRAEFLGPLYAESISSDQDVALTLQSQQRIDITAGSSELRLGQNTLNISTDSFQVFSQDQASPGEPLLSVTSEGVSVGAAMLDARGTLGTTLEGPLETSQIQSAPNQPLRLESPSGELRLIGSSGVSIQAGPLGSVDIMSAGDINLQAQNGDITLNAAQLTFSNLPIVEAGSASTATDVFEVCACASGRLYLVSATLAEGCLNSNDVCGP